VCLGRISICCKIKEEAEPLTILVHFFIFLIGLGVGFYFGTAVVADAVDNAFDSPQIQYPDQEQEDG
jgi:hypothetical protein